MKKHSPSKRQQDLSSKEITRGYKFCQGRIEKLWRQRQRVEAVLYMSVLVEFLLKELILHFEQIVEVAAMSCHVGFNPRNLYSKKDIENQPLGYLIHLLETYTRDKKLVQDLREFSRKRNACVHKIMDRRFKDIDRELKGLDIFFYRLLIRLMKLNIKQMDFMKKSFDVVCDKCFAEILPRQVKL